MTKNITRLIDNYSDAQAAVAELEKSGIPHSDISIVASNTDGAHDHHGTHAADGDAAGRGAGKGASVGGVLGGGAGLLAGLGIMAVPGLGPVVAAGWLVSTLAGVVGGAVAGGAAGGLVGSLKHAGVSEADAHVYSEGVRRGGTLVSVKVDDATEPKAREILSRFRATDAATRGAAYRESGWTAHDPKAPAYTAQQVAEERKAYVPTI